MPPWPLQLHPTLASDIPFSGLVPAKKEDRIPQWSYQETVDFIAIRGELEKDFTQTRRNKTLWEVIVARMKEKGYSRSAEQCKCKWKNLVNRYKGKETSELDNGRQCPFFEQLHAVFTERAKKFDGRLLESELGGRPKKKGRRGMLVDRSSEDLTDEEDEEEGESEDDRNAKSKKRTTNRERQRSSAEKCRANNIQEILEDFFQQQQDMELLWRKAMERREEERKLREQEFRSAMEHLENERIMMEQHWRERDEQRRAREEAQAEKRDALFDAILNRLAREEL